MCCSFAYIQVMGSDRLVPVQMGFFDCKIVANVKLEKLELSQNLKAVNRPFLDHPPTLCCIYRLCVVHILTIRLS